MYISTWESLKDGNHHLDVDLYAFEWFYKNWMIVKREIRAAVTVIWQFGVKLD